MDTLFYALLLVNFGFGVLAVAFLLLVRTEPEDPGTRSLALPFVALTLITAFQVGDYFLQQRYGVESLVLFSVLYDLAIAAIAFFWHYIVYRHYHLNGVTFMRPRGIGGIAAIIAVFGATTTVGHLWAPGIVAYAHAALIALLFAAGVMGVMITRRAEELLPSSRTAVTIAIVSLAVYPVIAVGDVLGWRLPFLDSRVTFWAQTHPLYVTAVSIPVAFYIRGNMQRGNQPIAAAVSPAEPTVDRSIADLLTRRENEVLLLLYDGLRYREIAEELSVSLTTVRTHVRHIYEKLGVARKEELFIKLRSENDTRG